MDNINLIRSILDKYHIDAYYQPSVDEFFSEYTPGYLNRLQFLTGFSGSNGSIIVTKEKSIFFTDGRYIEQAHKELSAYYEIIDIKDKKPWEYCQENKLNIGFNPALISCNHKFEKFTLTEDLVDLFWKRDKFNTKRNYFQYQSEFDPLTYEEKIVSLKQKMSEYNLDYYVITDAEIICWLKSLRGNDLSYCPLVLCNAIVSLDSIEIFYNGDEKFFLEISKLKNVGFDPCHSSLLIKSLLDPNAKELPNPLYLTRAKKHHIEIKNARKIHIEDAVAMCKLLCWVEENDNYDEMEVAIKSEEFRKENSSFFSLSFPTIAGYGTNSAIVHYKPEKETAKIVSKESLLLIDSGGQYYGGTTDISRTICFKDDLNYQRHLYTLVLMGHIDITISEFEEGASGEIFDQMARKYLLAEGYDYPHSTGHGVSNFLNVHETPPSFRKNDKFPLSENMIISNEPGVYFSNQFGIRIENMITIVQKKSKLGFDDLTLVPHENKLIEFSLLSEKHKQYLQQYYRKILQLILPEINCTKTKKWLERKCLI